MAQTEDFVTPARSLPAPERTPEAIQSEIERTRAALDETFDALDSKLKPGQLGRDAWEAVKDGSRAQAGRLRRLAGEHPGPLAAVGLAAGLLLGARLLRSRARSNGR